MPIDMSAAVKAPARKAASPRTRAASVPEPQQESQAQIRTRGLMGIGQLAQGLCVMTGLYADGAAIGQHFPGLATELANAADHSEVIAKPIDFLIEIGPYGALLAAAMPLVLQVMANHRMIDATRMFGQGIVPPEVLDAQMKAQVAKMQSEAMRAQQEALRDAREAQAQFEKLIQDAQVPA